MWCEFIFWLYTGMLLLKIAWRRELKVREVIKIVENYRRQKMINFQVTSVKKRKPVHLHAGSCALENP